MVVLPGILKEALSMYPLSDDLFRIRYVCIITTFNQHACSNRALDSPRGLGASSGGVTAFFAFRFGATSSIGVQTDALIHPCASPSDNAYRNLLHKVITSDDYPVRLRPAEIRFRGMSSDHKCKSYRGPGVDRVGVRKSRFQSPLSPLPRPRHS